MKNPLKLTLMLLALLLPATAIAENFWSNKIQYTITSDTTVKVIGQSFWNIEDHYKFLFDIDIPDCITYNNVCYTITEIGDSAFFSTRDPNTSNDDWYSAANISDNLSYTVTIPETITLIGTNAFGGYFDLINVIYLGHSLPILNDSFSFGGDEYSKGVINLFVLAETYPLFEEENNVNHYFSSIHITNGERTEAPQKNVTYYNLPPNYFFMPSDFVSESYACYGTISSTGNSVLYTRHIEGGFFSEDECEFLYTTDWEKQSNNNLRFSFYDDMGSMSGIYQRLWEIEAYALEEGKSPSSSIVCGGSFSRREGLTYDFEESGIFYNIINQNEVEVTYCAFDKYDYEVLNNEYCYIEDVVIPCTATYCDFSNDTLTTYTVTRIGNKAFENSKNMNSITIPETITYIGDGAFDGCTALKTLYFNAISCEEVSNRDSQGHIYSPREFITNIVFGDGVQMIPAYLGLFLTNLENVTIPHSVTTIGQLAFEGCSKLTSLDIPSSVTFIGWNAFSCCDELASLTIGKSVIEIGLEAFSLCPNLTMIKCLGKTPARVYLDEYLEDGFYFFDECVYQNATLYVPIDAVEAYRNAECWRNFQHIVGFYDYDFEGDGVYYKVTGENEVVVSSGEEAYSGNVVIPETVTVDGVTYTVTGIDSGAFANDSLNFLTIPVSVTANIASDAFEGCFVPSVYIIGEGAWADGALPASVDTLYISSDVTGVAGLQVNPSVIYSYAALPPTCDGNSFTGYDAELHVPASSLAAYFTEPYWSNFINIVSDAVEPTGLSLENDSISIMVGNQITLMATVTPDNATPQQVFWASTNDSIAKIGPINGELTALKAGECDIMATLLDKTVVCHITVTEIAPAEVTISQEFAKLEIGSQLTLTATVLPEDATDKVITWTTTNSDVATVDSLGNVMAMGQGECFITATCRDKQAMCHIIVVEHFIYITLDEHRLSLLPNHMEWLTPTVTPVSTDLVVTSSNPSVAAARMANGKIQVVGITEGTTIIKVNSVDGYAESDSCRVTVRTQRGDVNYDGFINITDVTMMISQLMSAQSESYYDINADVNNDGEVNISDVTRLISHLMTGAELEPKDENPIIYETFTVNGVSFKMIKVEGGTFMMGATEEEDADYQVFKGSPKHQVTLSDYSIGETEVTQELWIAVMGSNPSANTGDLLRPVENVNWNDCDTFIMRLNALTGKEFRLPSEAEWEFAAHGGNLTQGYIYAGSDSIDEVAWYIANSDNVTHPVATKVPNELGLYDMNGNAEEWCNDWYYLYTEEPVTNPTGPETGKSRVHRGGRYSGAVKFCRISRRDGFSPGVRRTYMGLRLAM